MDFDRVLQHIGEFGRYQQINYLLICLPVILAAANSMSYIFTSGVPNYRYIWNSCISIIYYKYNCYIQLLSTNVKQTNRCFVPECDDNLNPNYEEPWLVHALPSSTKKGSGMFVPEQCERFETNQTNIWSGDKCPGEWFSDNRLTCDRWVFDNYERTIVNDVWQ